MNASKAHHDGSIHSVGLQSSVYMIKPEAMVRRQEIRAMLARHLDLVTWTTLVVPPDVLNVLYPDLTGDLLMMTRGIFRLPVEIGLVAGPNAVAALLLAAGRHTAPHLCEPDTIRHRFGRWTPSIFPSGAQYYHNAIHRPKDPAEANQHLDLMLPWLSNPRP